MTWLDRLMDAITRSRPRVAGGGHPPADTQPPTGELPSERSIEYGEEPPPGESIAGGPPPGEPEL